MDNQFAAIQTTLRRQAPSLYRRFGVFGSAAANRMTAESDINLLVEFDRPIGFFAYPELEQELSQLLGRRIDLVTKPALKARIKDRVLATTRYV